MKVWIERYFRIEIAEWLHNKAERHGDPKGIIRALAERLRHDDWRCH